MDKGKTVNNTYIFTITQQPCDNGSTIFNSETIISISPSHVIPRQTNVMFQEILNTMDNFVSPDIAKSSSSCHQYF